MTDQKGPYEDVFIQEKRSEAMKKEDFSKARGAEKKLVEILKDVKLEPDGTLNEDAIKKVNSALTEITKENSTPPVALPGVPAEVRREFYKTAADFYTTKLGPSYKTMVSKYRTLYEISKKNKI